MTKSISPKLFFDSGIILDFPNLQVESVFDLLGNSLKEKVSSLLTELGVQEQPVIKGKVHPSAVIEGSVYIAEERA